MFKVEPVEIGRFLHEALERFVRALTGANADLGALGEAERHSRIAQAVAYAVQALGDSALKGSGQSRHLVCKLERVLAAAAGALGEHARRGKFRPVAVEASFGPTDRLPGLPLAVRTGQRVLVRGRIDRLDYAEIGGARYVLVVDYKRTPKQLAIEDVGHGLALQMALYLVVATKHGAGLVGVQGSQDGELTPGGMLYFPVQPNWQVFDGPPTEDEIAKEARKAHKAGGLLHLSAALDKGFETEPGYSPIVPLRLRKDGSVVEGQSRVADQGRLESLLCHAMDSAAELGEAILDGHVDVAPYRLRDRTPCVHCDYRPVCRFDPGGGDRYRDLPARDKAAAWAAIEGGVR